jgi:hypothetical protein
MAQHRSDGIAAALVLNDRIVGAGLGFERLGDEMRQPAIPGRRAVELAGIGLAVSDEFL